MEVLSLKALHLIFMVTWFAGLFYIVRLFIYFTEALDKTEPERSILLHQFRIMQRRLWYGITWPGMILTLTFGIWLALPYFRDQVPGWLILKLILVGGLVIYHLYCQYIFDKLGRQETVLKSFGLRILNEVATLFLFAIVFTASVLRYRYTPGLLLGLMGVLALILLVAIFAYRSRRKRMEGD